LQVFPSARHTFSTIGPSIASTTVRIDALRPSEEISNPPPCPRCDVISPAHAPAPAAPSTGSSPARPCPASVPAVKHVRTPASLPGLPSRAPRNPRRASAASTNLPCSSLPRKTLHFPFIATFPCHQREELNDRVYNWVWNGDGAEPSSYSRGEAIFRGGCGSCHTMNGYRSMRHLMDGRDQSGIHNFIVMLRDYKADSPYHRFMPPMAGTQKDIDDLTNYLNAGQSARPRQGEAVVDRTKIVDEPPTFRAPSLRFLSIKGGTPQSFPLSCFSERLFLRLFLQLFFLSPLVPSFPPAPAATPAHAPSYPQRQPSSQPRAQGRAGESSRWNRWSAPVPALPLPGL
jgi:cytochrome c553